MFELAPGFAMKVEIKKGDKKNFLNLLCSVRCIANGSFTVKRES